MYICIMNPKENTIDQEGALEAAEQERILAATKARKQEEENMRLYMKSQLPNLETTARYQELNAKIWEARLRELKARSEYIALYSQLNTATEEEEKSTESPTNGQEATTSKTE